MPDVVGEYVDRLMTVEMRPPGMPRGMIHQLYSAARRKVGKPLTLLAAEALRARVKPKQTVFIATGAGNRPYLPFGETDGPLGAAALGRILKVGLNATPVFMIEEEFSPALVAACRGMGLHVLPEEWARRNPRGCVVEELARELSDGGVSLFAKYSPSAVIAIEKLAPNRAGVIHSLQGVDLSEDNRNLAPLFREARRHDVLTIGVGDGGNEIGFASIEAAVRRVTTHGARCQCPCGRGVASGVATDHLVVAATSNWGAYGIEAYLAYLLKDISLLHDANLEGRALRACALAGASDGIDLGPIDAVDGIDLPTNLAFLQMLHGLIANGLRSVTRAI